MREDPKRRYASVRDLGADIRAYLDFKPVSARSDRVSYRAQKFIRRNWGAVASIAALIVVLFAGMWLARREARIARMHFDQVRRLANTFVTDVHDEIRNLPGSTRARKMIVKTGLEYLEALAANAQGDVDLQREIGAGYLRIGEVQGAVLEPNLGDPNGALNSYAKALQLLEDVARRRPEALDVQSDILKIHVGIGDINSYIKSTDAALRSYAHARAVGETLLSQQPNDDKLRRRLADVYQAQSRLFRLAENAEAARESANRAVELYRVVLKTTPGDAAVRKDIASTLASEGMALARMHRRDEALARFEEVVKECESLLARDPDNTGVKRSLMLAYSHIGDVRSTPGIATPADIAEALPPFLKMYAIAEQLHKADPADYRALSDLGIAVMRVANVTQDKGEKLRHYNEALGYMNQAAQTNKDLMVQMNAAYVHTRMGDILRERGFNAEAVRHYREGMQSAEKVVAVDVKNTSSRRSLMEDLRWLGEDAARRRALREAAEYRQRLLDGRRRFEAAEGCASAGARLRRKGLRRSGIHPRVMRRNGSSSATVRVGDCRVSSVAGTAGLFVSQGSAGSRDCSRAIALTEPSGLAHLLDKLAGGRVYKHGIAAGGDRSPPDDTPCQERMPAALLEQERNRQVGVLLQNLGALLDCDIVRFRGVDLECLDRPCDHLSPWSTIVFLRAAEHTFVDVAFLHNGVHVRTCAAL